MGWCEGHSGTFGDILPGRTSTNNTLYKECSPVGV